MLTKVAVIILAIVIIWFLYRLKTTHIGYGWLLQFNEEKRPEVVIVARLLNSPAGEAGIPNGAVMLERDGVKLNFTTNEEMKKWIDGLPKAKKGISTTCIIRDGQTERMITLTPRRVRKKIPTYGTYNGSKFVGGYMVREGMKTCPLTGQLHQTISLTEI